MIRLDRYVAWTVTLMMVLAGVGLLGVLSLFTMLEQLESLRHEYNLQAVLRYMAYTTPRRFYELVPYTALIGCLAGLGMLASNSEGVTSVECEAESADPLQSKGLCGFPRKRMPAAPAWAATSARCRYGHSVRIANLPPRMSLPAHADGSAGPLHSSASLGSRRSE